MARPPITNDEVESTGDLLDRMEAALSQLERLLLGEVKRRQRDHLTLVRQQDEDDDGS